MAFVYSPRQQAMLPRLSIAQRYDEIIVHPGNGQWEFEGIIEATDADITALQEVGYHLRDLRTVSLSSLLEEWSGDDPRHKSRPRQTVLFDEVFVENEWAVPLASERRERAKIDEQARVLMRTLANERQERAKGDEQASVLMRALANERQERAKGDEHANALVRVLADERRERATAVEQVAVLTRLVAEERANVKRLNSVLSNERGARRLYGWLCGTLIVTIAVITLVFLYVR